LTKENELSAHDLANAVWRKSRRSNGDGNVCVEVAYVPTAVAMRDSKNPAGGVLVVPAAGWNPLWLAAIEGGRHSR
jgi:hypothetical protein